MNRAGFSLIILSFAFLCNAKHIIQKDGNSVPCMTDYLVEYESFPELGGSLKLHREAASLDAARQKCEGEGSIVASPTNSKFLDTMQLALFKSGLETLRTGIHTDGFVSMRGIPLSEMPECLAAANTTLNIVLRRDGTIESVDADKDHPFLCFKTSPAPSDGDTHSSTAKTPSCANGYEFSAETNSCYKLHKVELDFNSAKDACVSEGARLAIINSIAEANVLQAMIANQPKEYITIGFLYSDADEDWVTVEGQTLDAAGYSRWKTGEPNRLGGDWSCGAFCRDALFFATRCNLEHYYICEMPPN